MMKKAFRTFLNLLLAASLAFTPVSIALGTGGEEPAHHAATESCHQSDHKQAVDSRQATPLMASCSCCNDDFSCPDDTPCDHETASPVYTLPIDIAASQGLPSRIFTAALPCTYYSLNSPPDSPPPVA